MRADWLICYLQNASATSAQKDTPASGMHVVSHNLLLLLSAIFRLYTLRSLGIITPQINCTDTLKGCLHHLCDKRGYKEFTTSNCAKTCARCHVSELASKLFQIALPSSNILLTTWAKTLFRRHWISSDVEIAAPTAKNGRLKASVRAPYTLYVKNWGFVDRAASFASSVHHLFISSKRAIIIV